jgi:hypothetical protein
VAGPLGVLLIETDRTLVDSHSTLFGLILSLKPWLCRLFLANDANCQHQSMSVFAPPASQIWGAETRGSRTQFRTGEAACCIRVVSRRNTVAKRREALGEVSGYTAAKGRWIDAGTA